jgi:hypothetical protein
MANDERRSDTFIREVDEELRRDQLKALWTRFGPLFIAVCVLIVAVTAGYRGWLWWEERKAAEAGDRFMAALTKIESGDREAGEAELAAIAEQSETGYSALARLRLAGEKAAAGAKPEALAAYDEVANDTSVPGPLRDLGRIRAALLALDTRDLAGAKERAETLNTAGNAWRHAAREVIGTAAYEAGDLQAARDAFLEIQQDAQTPPDLWVRSGLMISLIDGQLAAPGTEAEPESSGATEPEEPAGSPDAAGEEASAADDEAGTGGTPEASATDASGDPSATGGELPVPAPDASGAPPITTTP